MMPTNQKLSLHESATYRIQVQGQLDERWSPNLGEMMIESTVTPNQGPVTTLEGTLLDQAALAGVLNTLYSLGLPLLSVQYVPSE